MIYTWYSVVRQLGASCIINRVDEDVGASFCHTNNNYVMELKKKKLKRYIQLLNKFIIATPYLVIFKFFWLINEICKYEICKYEYV